MATPKPRRYLDLVETADYPVDRRTGKRVIELEFPNEADAFGASRYLVHKMHSVQTSGYVLHISDSSDIRKFEKLVEDNYPKLKEMLNAAKARHGLTEQQTVPATETPLPISGVGRTEEEPRESQTEVRPSGQLSFADLLQSQLEHDTGGRTIRPKDRGR